MENNTYCQSCSMPLELASNRGTEQNGLLSTEYCKYCYQDGKFVSPDMSLDEMRDLVKTQMLQRKISTDVILKATNILPFLKRWRKN